MIEPSIPFNSYFDQQGQDNILNKLMDFKANRWKDAVGQGFQGLNAAISGEKDRNEKDRQKQLVQKLAMQMQNMSQPQQGPPAPAGPAIQGPQGYVPPGAGPSAVPAGQTPMQQNPTSGIGAPTGQDSSALIGTLIQMDPSGELVQKLIAQRMGMGQSPMNPLQQSEIAKNQAMAKRYSMPPQQKPTNPLDDALKQQRIKAIQALLARQGQPKPPAPVNPVQAARLQFDVDKANASNQSRWPWQKAPVLKNPLQGKATTTSPEAQGLSDDDLMAIANGQDESQ